MKKKSGHGSNLKLPKSKQSINPSINKKDTMASNVGNHMGMSPKSPIKVQKSPGKKKK